MESQRSADDEPATVLIGDGTPTRSKLDEPGAEPTPGLVIGRYVVVEPLGRGGMGLVLRAYDPKLRREVALKLVRPRAASDEARARLLREAQALARLAHPNVVTVYDAEDSPFGVAIALEYVEGSDLRAWLDAGPRAWREVLRVLVAAANGLAAAHAAGLIHRDVKPANILVGSDGRVRMTDFGLARAAGDAQSGSSGYGPEVPDERLTQLGTVMGTPAYMAPEQHAGATADARTDLYSLCVTAWEALYGSRPFDARGAAPLLEQKSKGPPPRPRSNVPRWVHAVIARGLAPRPEDRWPSVEACLAALGRAERRVWLRRGAMTVAGVGLAVAAMLGQRALERRRIAAQCEAAGAEIDAVWNAQARSDLEAALSGTGVGHAEVTAQKVMPWLDRHAEAWRAARTGACLDASLHAVWDADTHDRAVWCLDERKMELAALVNELTQADASVVHRAVPAAAGLPSPEGCRDTDRLARADPPPTEQREVLRGVRADLAQVRALLEAGRYEQGIERARATLIRAEALGWVPVTAAARVELGELLGKTGSYADAERELEAAFFEASERGLVELSADAALKLMYLVGSRMARSEDGFRWGKHARVALRALGEERGLRMSAYSNNMAVLHRSKGELDEALALYAQVLEIDEETLGLDHPSVAMTFNNLGAVHFSAAQYDEAKKVYLRALTMFEQALGADHPDVAMALNNLASVHAVLGEHEEAKAFYAKSAAIRERSLGPDHPDVAGSLANLGNVHLAMGNYDEARELYERALEIRERSLGPEHPHVAANLSNLGGILQATGEWEEAKRIITRAVEIWEKALGPEHADVANGLNNLAGIHHALGEDEQAKALHERALAIREKALPPDHPNIVSSLENLASVHLSLGERALARQRYERALALAEASLGKEHPDLGYSLCGLAQVALEDRRPTGAVALAERCLAVREKGNVTPDLLARAQFILARALWESHGDRNRAVELARRARDRARERPTQEKLLATVEDWLEDHG